MSEDTPQLRVLVVSLMREHGGTGLQTHVRTFRDHLASSGVPVEVVTPFTGRSPTRNAVLGARLGLAAVSGTASVWWYRRWHAHYLSRALRDRLTSYDGPTVVYAQCPVSADVALRVRTDEPVVLAAHLNGSQADEWAGKGVIAPGGALFAAIRALEERVLPQLDGVVHVSEHGRRALEDRVPGVASVVLPNFVDPLPLRVRAEVAGDLVTVGALEPRKDQGYLLHVLAEAARLGVRPTLTVVGIGPDRRRLERLAARLGVADQVRFAGYVDDVRALVARHRLYVHTARQESFGLALLEALAEGVPVLAGEVGGIPELVRPGVDGAFWPLDDPSAAARVLLELLEDPARLAALGTAGREHVRTAYATEVVAPRLTAFLYSRAALASVP